MFSQMIAILIKLLLLISVPIAGFPVVNHLQAYFITDFLHGIQADFNEFR
jgi:hypothetical protein